MVLCLKAWKSRSLPGFFYLVMKFSIVVPLHNEELSIENLYNEINSYNLYINIIYLLILEKNPGNDLLFHALRHSTIGANSFHSRVRDGIVCLSIAIVTRKQLVTKLFSVRYCNQANRVISISKLHALLHFHI